MRSFLPLFLDTLFVWFASFTLSIVLLRYYSTSPIAVVTAVAISLLLSILFVKRTNKKRQSKINGKKERLNRDQTLLTLNFMPTKNLYSLFERMLKTYDVKFSRSGNVITLPSHNAVILLSCGIDGVSKTDVVKTYNRTLKDGVGAIFCTSISQEVLDFSKRFSDKIKIVDGDKVYAYLKNADALPQPNVTILPPKKPNIVRAFFEKRNAKRYLFLGLSFFLMSFFVSIKLYYITFGSALIIFAIACKFFAVDKKNKN